VRGKEFELPAEALTLIEEVRQLEARAEDARRALGADLRDIRETASKERAEVASQRAELASDREALEALLKSRVRGFEYIADAWADYERAKAKAAASALQRKSHPARSAASEVRAKGREMAELRRELKRAEWVLRLYEWHFPWLTELREFEEEQSYVAGEEAVDTGVDGQPADPAQRWLSHEEYQRLPEVERNQRALDRYLRSRKTPWQLGRDYERYIGYLRERLGARVTYQGIFAGLEDLGRDLLAEHDGVTEVIQCKRWSQRKTIHEKHVFQLFGTVVAARIEHPDHQVTGTFTTTTALSERAHDFARQLNIRVEENVPLEDYPRIKCNIGRTGERIYHLPFDQQYDTTVISPRRGEVWASTAAEAEALGFRRAWRWRPAVATTPP
jgi:Restriction endonuclease